MAVHWRAAARAWSSFEGLDARTRAFLLARMAVAPLGPMEPELLALRGRVLSLGCGHGAVDRYLAEMNPHVTVDGVELDAARVRQAAVTQQRAPRVRVRLADVTTLQPAERYDAALAVDVLHHVPADDHRRVVAALLRSLRPGGLCLVKEMAPEPRRQYLWNRFHDRIVAGPEPIHCRAPADLAELLLSVGFRIDGVRRLRRLGLYPQYLVLASVLA